MLKVLVIKVLISCLLWNVIMSQDCTVFPEQPLGMTDKHNGITDKQIIASSTYSPDTAPYYGRLHYSDAFLWNPYLPGSGAWLANDQNTAQFIQVDLLERKVITSIGTQGRQGSREFVRDYYVDYSDSAVPDLWTLYRDIYGQPYLFDGNIDDNTVIINNLTNPIVARHVRIRPQRWNRVIALRFELFGCQYIPWTAYFDGNSRIDYRLDLLGRSVQTAEDRIKFRFKTNKINGVILYADGGQSDYITVELFRSRLRFRLNLGSTPDVAPESMDNILDAGSMLDDNQWHDVEIIRVQKDVNITLDRVKMWRNITADFMHLNLNRNVSIGGLRNFAGKRGLTVLENFVGCMEEMVFNGVQMIRDSRRMLQMDKNQNRSWQDVLYYPAMSETIWWGDQLNEGQLKISNFVTVGAVGSSCPASASFFNVVTFPSLDTSSIFIKVITEGLLQLTFSVSFRTFNRDGTLFYHAMSDMQIEYIYLGINKGTGYLEVEVTAKGIRPIVYSVKNPDLLAQDRAFSDGMWHTVSLNVDKNTVILIADGVKYTSSELFTSPLALAKEYYIGGGRPAVNSFQGCMRNILINNVEIVYDPKTFDPSIRNGTCTIIDRCTPNPCVREAPCTQNGQTFFCNCTLTGYAGEVCHQSPYPTSCSELSLRYAGLQSKLTTLIDLDASGVLPPFQVTCDFTVSNTIITEVHHNYERDVQVEGALDPGSFKVALSYGAATREALGELTRRASYCEQSINYKCFAAKLLSLPPGGGTNRYNQAWGWWVGRRGQPLFYWGGGIPGKQMCACGVQGTCAGNSPSCNCDGDVSSGMTSQTDSGLLADKNDLPVMEVRLGDTTSVTGGKYSILNVNFMRCMGDSLFDNTVTFTKPDAVIYLPSLYAETEFEMVFLFKTTVLNCVILQSLNKKNSHFFEVRIREGNALRFTFDVGYGIQIVEVTTANWINDNNWHSVKFERNRKQSRLIVDENLPVTHNEDPDRPYTAFNFQSPLYLGSTQAFTDGFLGCFSNLIINGRIQDLRAAITDSYGIQLGCKPKCDAKPCLHRGECYEFYSHYYCECGLSPYRGFVCGREVGATLIDGTAVKITLDYSDQVIGTLEEYIEIGFKTKSKVGTLLQVSSKDQKEYIIIKINNNGGITIEFDVGFQRYEFGTNYIVDLCNDQHHTLRAWRSNMGQKWNLQVDDYPIIESDYSKYLSANSDTRLDNPMYVYVGRNFSMNAQSGFTGCVYRMQFNNIFPLRVLFNVDKLPNVEVQGEGIRENNCGKEEIMPKLDPIEIKKYPPIPPYSAPVPIQDWQKNAIIIGVVFGVFILVVLILLVVFFRNFTVEQGTYETREAKGAKNLDTADNAVRYGNTGQPDVSGKEWWI